VKKKLTLKRRAITHLGPEETKNVAGGNGQSDYDPTCDQPSCYGTCGHSCGGTCDATCPQTCEDTCADTCGNCGTDATDCGTCDKDSCGPNCP